MLNVASRRQPLPPVSAQVDQALCDLDDRIDWLTAFSPLNSKQLWQTFVASGHRTVPEPEYQPHDDGLSGLRRRLLDLPIEDVEPPSLRALLNEKQREIDRHIELIELRGTDGVLSASIDLWGDVEPSLLAQAEETIDTLRGTHPSAEEVGLDSVLETAQRLLAWYHERDPRLSSRIFVDDDLNSKLVVSRGHLHIDRNIRVPRDQVEPLMQHEIGTHVVTRHNGSLQPIRQLGTGLAHYDGLQEGLGVLSEYLAGRLSPERLRVVAARVVATDMICHGASVPDIYARLVDAELAEHDAFDVALRAARGGGLTKDVVYLRGLRDLLAYLAHDGDLTCLFIGKFSLSHLSALEHLAEQGHVIEPALLPSYLDSGPGRERLERCRHLALAELAMENTAS